MKNISSLSLETHGNIVYLVSLRKVTTILDEDFSQSPVWLMFYQFLERLIVPAKSIENQFYRNKFLVILQPLQVQITGFGNDNRINFAKLLLIKEKNFLIPKIHQ